MPLTPGRLFCIALFDATDKMGLTNEELGSMIGMDQDSVERLISMADMDMNTKSGELALIVIEIYRSLCRKVGTDRENVQHWLRTENSGVNGMPAELMKDVKGLMRVLGYLDWIGQK